MNRVMVVALGAVLTVSCGGGGSSGGTNPSVYTGKTTAAEINDGTEAVTRSAAVVTGALAQSELIASLSGNAVGARVPMALVNPDACGGSVDETETGGAAAGSYSATFDTFHPDCATQPDTYLDGGLQVNWSDSGAYMHNTVALNRLAYVTGGHHYLFDGSFVWDEYDDGHDVYKATFEASLDAESFKADGFEMRANANGAYYLKGRYYLADYGYIDFETTTPFDWTGCAGGPAPASGIMTITAAGGDVWTLDFSVGDCAAVHVTGPGYDEILNWPAGDVAAP